MLELSARGAIGRDSSVLEGTPAKRELSAQDRHSRQLRVVLVSRLEAWLVTEAELGKISPELAVLTSLAKGEDMLTTVDTAEVSCALVSYRQEGPTTKSEFDAVTLDGQALRGIVGAARRLQCDAVWLDAWCYRSRAGGEYDHADFCQTLSDVVEGCEAVIWLPRSKSSSTAEYAFRLWCAFT